METDENQHGDEVAKLVMSFTRHEIGHWMPKKTARRWKLTAMERSQENRGNGNGNHKRGVETDGQFLA